MIAFSFGRLAGLAVSAVVVTSSQLLLIGSFEVCEAHLGWRLAILERRLRRFFVPSSEDSASICCGDS